LFSDEKYFNVNQVINSQTDRFITNKKAKNAPPEVKSLQKSKHPAQIMMFGLVASNGIKMPPVFLESGFRMGAKDYLAPLDQLPQQRGCRLDAGCHTAKSVQKRREAWSSG
jgi:hypothetical protein